jgi:hypothetical protein
MATVSQRVKDYIRKEREHLERMLEPVDSTEPNPVVIGKAIWEAIDQSCSDQDVHCSTDFDNQARATLGDKVNQLTQEIVALWKSTVLVRLREEEANYNRSEWAKFEEATAYTEAGMMAAQKHLKTIFSSGDEIPKDIPDVHCDYEADVDDMVIRNQVAANNALNLIRAAYRNDHESLKADLIGEGIGRAGGGSASGGK